MKFMNFSFMASRVGMVTISDGAERER